MKKCIIIIISIFLSSFSLQIIFSQTFPGDYSLYIYYSSDGTTFSNPVELIDSSDVPSVVQDSTGKLFCLYQCFKGGQSSPYMGKIGIKTSIDNGLNWSSNGYINLTGLSGTSDKAFDPTITITPDNKYRLYFSYCPENSTSLDSTCATYSAISNDGINYVVDTGVRFGATHTPVIDPAVVYFDSLWQYTAPIPPPNGGGARHATSTDGINFTLIDSLGVGDTHYKWTGNLLNDGTSMRFYGYSDNVAGNFIWWSESTDGITWSSYNFTNISETKDPGIVKLSNGSYVMIVPRTESPLALNDLKKTISIKVSPNPFEENIFFQWKNKQNKKWEIVIVDTKGRVLHTQHSNEDVICIGTEDLFSGQYFYMFYIAEELYKTGKISHY